jgi:hypothetical protein
MRALSQIAIHVRIQFECPEYSTCYACHRSYHAKSEYQLSVNMCASCFEMACGIGQAIWEVHVMAQPSGRIAG